MQFSRGNEKLGTNCNVVSRAVGDTCPSSCDFLGNGCYAEGTERVFKNSRAVGLRNMITEAGKIRSVIIDAINKGISVRWHERGDFFKNGELDIEYVTNIALACYTILEEGKTLPRMWAYTHIYDNRIVETLGQYITLYASVHNKKHLEDAKAAGFKLFAWCDTNQQFAPKKKRGKASGEQRKVAPKLAIIEGERYITCPEMLQGRDKITCTGGKDKKVCDLCVRGLANVLFLNH